MASLSLAHGHRPRTRRRVRERFKAYRDQRRQELPGEPFPPRAAVPSFLTLMNLLCGFLAITQVYEGDFIQACWLIVIAGFFDMIDGMMARLTNGTSSFGVELDSLSDIVSFGVAPAFLVYAFSLKDYGNTGLIISSLPAVCGAIRLARFNITFDGEKKPYFLGLPIPMQAVAIVAVVLNFDDVSLLYSFRVQQIPMLMLIVVMLSAFMVTNIRFDAAPKPSAHYIKAHPFRASLYLVGLIVIIIFQQYGLLLTLTVYLFHGMLQTLYVTYQKVRALPPPE